MSDFHEPTDWHCDISWERIKAAFEKLCPEGFYRMELVGQDQEIAQDVWNQGIDSRLEAITEPSSACWVNRGFGPRLSLKLDINGLLVFLRRLYEYTEAEEPDEGEDTAYMLYSAVLETLDIEV